MALLCCLMCNFPHKSKANDSTSQPLQRKRLDPERREYSFLPATDYSSDTGLGLGMVGMIAQFRKGFYPYRWRLYFELRTTMSIDHEGKVNFPFHKYFAKLDLPDLLGGRLRLNMEAGFFRYISTGYYGLGNASLRDQLAAKIFYQYDRIYPSVLIDATIALYKRQRRSLRMFVGGIFLYNIINIFPDSLLMRDLWHSHNRHDDTSKYLKANLRGLNHHPLLKFKWGLLFDSRDHEFDPSRGMFHELSLRGSPGIASHLHFGGLFVNTRFYLSLWRRYLVLAFQAVADLLFGNVPIYELSSLGGLSTNSGLGGNCSLRGLPAGRFSGKIKLFGNMELRSMFWPFRLFGQHLKLGATIFFDLGRVWLEYSYQANHLRRAFDGDHIGLKTGVGGGLRLQWGETFVVRFDAAWSPSELSHGIYFVLGHLF